jgi:hypothetical protein
VVRRAWYILNSYIEEKKTWLNDWVSEKVTTKNGKTELYYA